MSRKRKKLNKRPFLYSIIAALGLFVVVQFSIEHNDFSILKTSVLSVLENLIEESMPEPPDLAIKSISLQKTNDPDYNFNHYQYDATVLISNEGGQLLNSSLKISGSPDQQHKYIKNNEKGFALLEDENYILKGYDVLFDGKYNGGEITFDLDLKAYKQEDYYLDNNTYTVPIFEEPANLEGIEVGEILDDGTFALNFEPEYFYLNEDNFEIYVSDSYEFLDSEMRYDEVFTQDKIYSYYRVKNSLDVIESKVWKSTPTSSMDAHFVKFSDDPFNEQVTRAVYIKATNPESGFYVYSNIIVLPPQKDLNRAEFAKWFVDYSNVTVFDVGQNMFDDVDSNEWYAPYVQTVYNLGLMGGIETRSFHPNDIITRGDALRVVLDHFDVDLVSSNEVHFEDVPMESYLFHYAEGLQASGKGQAFDGYLYPEFPATKNYLKYLINGYQESN